MNEHYTKLWGKVQIFFRFPCQRSREKARPGERLIPGRSGRLAIHPAAGLLNLPGEMWGSFLFFPLRLGCLAMVVEEAVVVVASVGGGGGCGVVC